LTDKLASKYKKFWKGGATGDVGIEIETEGKNIYLIGDSAGAQFPSQYWNSVKEGSLRGGIEYILKRPILIEHVTNALEEWKELTKLCQFKNSIRTSIHVHVNVQNYTYQQIYNVIGCFWLFEALLVKLNGPTREGNLFCLRSGDAEAFVFAVMEDLKRGQHFKSFSADAYRYSSLNLESLSKFGSIEFRFMKGTTDIREIELWTKALFHMCEYSKNVNLFNISQLILASNAPDFLYNFFPREFLYHIFKHVTEEEAYNLMMEGYCYTYRLAQKMAKPKMSYPVINAHHEDLEAAPSGLKPWMVNEPGMVVFDEDEQPDIGFDPDFEDDDDGDVI
jgi:hypothetical protein